MPARDNEALFITALGFCQVCAWGSLYYSYPLIVEAMMPELGWTREQAYGPATLGLLVAAFLTWPVGVAIDRGFGRLVLAGSSLLAAGLFFIWSQVHTLTAFYLVATTLGALQASTLYEPAFAVLTRRVGIGKARQGITQITLWGGFASTVFIPLVQFFLDHWSWREALWCLAVVNGLLAALYMSQVHPNRDLAHRHAATEEQLTQDRQAFRATMRNRIFWLLIVAMVAYASAFSAFTFHMYPMLLEGGLHISDVILALALIGPSQVAGRILISWLGRHSSIRRIGCWTVALLPPVFPALLIFGDHLVVVALMCCLYGAANGIFTIVRSLVVAEMITPHAYGALNGIINLPATLARATAPWAAAALWSVTQSYSPVLWAITAAFIVLALAFWFAARQSVRQPITAIVRAS